MEALGDIDEDLFDAKHAVGIESGTALFSDGWKAVLPWRQGKCNLDGIFDGETVLCRGGLADARKIWAEAYPEQELAEPERCTLFDDSRVGSD